MAQETETFLRDLARGEQIEEMVLEIIRQKYSSAHKIDGYFKEWDIYVPELSVGVEVKSDEMSQQTGNIVIEIEFNGKPSALSTTKAAYWVWWDGEVLTWFTPEGILRAIESESPPLRTFTAKGDTKAKKAYLIKKHKLFKYSLC